jgi:hypothetical protein
LGCFTVSCVRCSISTSLASKGTMSPSLCVNCTSFWAEIRAGFSSENHGGARKTRGHVTCHNECQTTESQKAVFSYFAHAGGRAISNSARRCRRNTRGCNALPKFRVATRPMRRARARNGTGSSQTMMMLGPGWDGHGTPRGRWADVVVMPYVDWGARQHAVRSEGGPGVHNIGGCLFSMRTGA